MQAVAVLFPAAPPGLAAATQGGGLKGVDAAAQGQGAEAASPDKDDSVAVEDQDGAQAFASALAFNLAAAPAATALQPPTPPAPPEHAGRAVASPAIAPLALPTEAALPAEAAVPSMPDEATPRQGAAPLPAQTPPVPAPARPVAQAPVTYSEAKAVPTPAAAVPTPANASEPPPPIPVAAPPAPVAAALTTGEAEALTAAAAAPPQAVAGPPAKAESRSTRADARVMGKDSTPGAPGAAQAPLSLVTAAAVTAGKATDDTGEDTAARPGAEAPAAAKTDTADQTSPAPQVAAQAHLPPASNGARADATTVPHLTSQILRKLESKTTRFDIELNPAGLGRVDVKIEIAASGALTAALSFDNPHAAAELRARAEELRAALNQAGFDLSDAGLSFNLSNGQRWAGEQPDTSRALAGKAMADAAAKADDLLTAVGEAAARLQRRGASGVDIRI